VHSGGLQKSNRRRLGTRHFFGRIPNLPNLLLEIRYFGVVADGCHTINFYEKIYRQKTLLQVLLGILTKLQKTRLAGGDLSAAALLGGKSPTAIKGFLRVPRLSKEIQDELSNPP
jgi:hypothetical protein